jgi:hypothetical protein
MAKKSLAKADLPSVRGGTRGMVKLAHSLSEAIGGMSEHGMRLAVYACAEAVRTETQDLAIRVAEVAREAGGDEKEMYAWAKKSSLELGIRYLLQDDEAKGFVHVDLISGRVEYRDGVLRLRMGDDTYRELIEQRSYHTLAHLENLRRLKRGRARLALYLLLATWDAAGEMMLPADCPQTQTITKRKLVPSRMYDQYLRPAAAHISERLGIQISSEMIGRGRQARYVFRWTPNALRTAAGDPVGLKLPAPNKDELMHSATCAKLRMAGVRDPGIGRKLAVMPSSEAARVVDEALAQSLSGRALHDRIMSAVGTWLLEGDRRASRAATRASEDAAEEVAAAQKARETAQTAEAAPGGPRRAEYEAWLAGQDEFLQGAAESVRLAAWAGEQMGVS